ncbi:MAG: hypothetical protein LBB36_04190, partial [Fibromonadaceae bacterium]|nr:hypothetical protein [Fibromonadaceae bacterium]
MAKINHCQNLDSLDLRISMIALTRRLFQKHLALHNPINLLIMLIMVQTIILTISCGDEFPERNFDELAKGYNYKYCIFKDDEMCIEGLFAFCPRGGTLGNRCPYAEGPGALENNNYCVFIEDDKGACFRNSFKVCPVGGDLSVSCIVDGKDEYGFCIFAEDGMCLEGPYSHCPEGGMLSDLCPYAVFPSIGITYGYCIFAEDGICLEGSHSDCPGGGKLGDICPYEQSSSSSSECVGADCIIPSSSSSAEDISSSSAVPMCGTKEYNPAAENCCGNSVIYPKELNATCINGVVWTPCGAGVYDISRSFCLEGISYPLCDGERYNPEGEFCYRDAVNGEELKDKCSGKIYESPEFCFDDFLFVFCGAIPYNTDTHFCHDNSEVREIGADYVPSSSSAVPLPEISGMIDFSNFDYSDKYYINSMPEVNNSITITNNIQALCGPPRYEPDSWDTGEPKTIEVYAFAICNGTRHEFGSATAYIVDRPEPVKGTGSIYFTSPGYFVGGTMPEVHNDVAISNSAAAGCGIVDYEPKTWNTGEPGTIEVHAVAICDGKKYTLAGASAEVAAKCGDDEYDRATEKCCNGVIYPNSLGGDCSNGAVWAACGSGSYNFSTQFCSGGKSYMLCNGRDYEPANQFCYADISGSEIKEKCGGKIYEPPQFCLNGNSIFDHCAGSTYNTNEKFCYDNSDLRDLCGGSGGKPYSTTEFCEDGEVLALCGSDEYNTATHFCDDRDDKLYKHVTIGEQTWMAENLNFTPTGANGTATNYACYDDEPENCEKYGLLYDWATAMGINESYNSTRFGTVTKHQGICPSGWRVPTNAEWIILFGAVGGTGTNNFTGAATKLKAGGPDWNGTNDYGFSVLPGGYWSTSSGNYYNILTN